jgi:CRP-like cAMP-binding protein
MVASGGPPDHEEGHVARLKDKAARLFGKGRYDKAVLAYREVVAADPRDMSSRLRLGDAYRRIGKANEAVACYGEVADYYARDGMLLKAIAACKLVLEVKPDHKETQSLLADLYSQRYGHAPASVTPPKPEESEAVAAVDATAAESTAVQPVSAEPAGPRPAAAGQAPIPVAQPQPEPEPDVVVEDDEGDDDPFVVHLGDDDDEGVEIDLDALDDEPIDVGRVEPPPPPPAPEQRDLPPIPLFSDLDREAFIELLERMSVRQVEAGEAVIREGDTDQAFFVVISGSLQVTRKVEGETLQLAVLGEGHFFGEMAVLSDRPRTATVTAQTDSELFELDRALLDDLTARHESVREALERFYRQRLLGNVMATSPIFRPFEKTDRRTLVERFNAVEVSAGDSVLEEGAPSDGLYLVLSGELVAVRGKGFAEVTLGRLADGDVFGEMSLLSQDPATASVKALRRSVLLRLPREKFTEVIMTHPQILEVVSRLSYAREKENEAILARVSANLSLDVGEMADDMLVLL